MTCAGGWHRVAAACRSGAAAQQPAARQPQAAAQSVPLQSLGGVLRTGRAVPAARASPRADLLLVQPDRGKREAEQPGGSGARLRTGTGGLPGGSGRSPHQRRGEEGQLWPAADQLGQAAAGLDQADVAHARVARPAGPVAIAPVGAISAVGAKTPPPARTPSPDEHHAGNVARRRAGAAGAVRDRRAQVRTDCNRRTAGIWSNTGSASSRRMESTAIAAS